MKLVTWIPCYSTFLGKGAALLKIKRGFKVTCVYWLQLEIKYIYNSYKAPAWEISWNEGACFDVMIYVMCKQN